MKPIPLERASDVTIKQGYQGFACAAGIEAGGVYIPIIVIAGTPEQAAAVCEFLAGIDMDLAAVKPAVVGGDPRA